MLRPSTSHLLQSLAAGTDERLQPRRISPHQPVIGHISRHHRPRSHHRPSPNCHTANDGRVGADGCPLPDEDLADIPVIGSFGRTVHIDRARTLVIADDSPGLKDTVGKVRIAYINKPRKLTCELW
jgi:hypothetical protein